VKTTCLVIFITPFATISIILLSNQFGIRTSIWDIILVSSIAGIGAVSYIKPLSSKIRIKTNELGIPFMLFIKVVLRLIRMPSHALKPPE
jgi:phosphate/sulfate permease